MRLTFTDDQGHSEEIDFDEILTRDDRAPDELAHARVMRALEDLPVGQVRSDVVADMERMHFVSFMLDRVTICQRCDTHVLLDHAWVDETGNPVCDRCEAPPADELARRAERG